MADLKESIALASAAGRRLGDRFGMPYGMIDPK